MNMLRGSGRIGNVGDASATATTLGEVLFKGNEH